MFWSSEWHPAEQHAGWAAGGEGGAAALRQGPGGRAELPQTAGSAPPELPGAGEAEEQHGAGKPARSVTASGLHCSSYCTLKLLSISSWLVTDMCVCVCWIRPVVKAS